MWFVGAAVALLTALILLRNYAEPETKLYILAVVGFSWALSFTIFLVLPFDLEHTFCRRCMAIAHEEGRSIDECRCMASPSIELLPTVITIAYYIALYMGYVSNDLMMGYICSGEFTRRGRLRDALREAMYFYVPCLIIGLVFVIYLIIAGLFDYDALMALGRGLINVVGLFILVAFLSYGLVEVPRHLWNKGDIEGQLRFLQFKAALKSEELQGARRRLDEVVEVVHATEAQLRTEAAGSSSQNFARLQANLSIILRQCPPPASSAAIPPIAEGGHSPPTGGRRGVPAAPPAASPPAAGRAEMPVTHKSLVALHLRLKRALSNDKRARSMYEHYVRQGIEQIRVVEVYKLAKAGGAPQGGGGGASKTVLTVGAKLSALGKPLLTRSLSLCCLSLSLILIWSEGTILLAGEPFNLNLSPLYYFFRLLGSGGGGAVTLGLIAFPVLYCAVCAYFAMFRMNMCESYALHGGRHSDAAALLFNATYACRLGPPICFNFLKLIHSDQLFATETEVPVQTFFNSTRFSSMDKIPIFPGDTFDNYAPLLIVFLCGATYLNLGEGLLSCCACCLRCVRPPSFSFDEDFTDGRIDHGAQILLREAQALAGGAPLGTNLQLLSGATSDSEEGTKKPEREGRARGVRRWDQLADDNI